MSAHQNSPKETQHYHRPLPAWEPQDYTAIGDPLFSSTLKLHSSRVAPLVAASRGYRTLQPKQQPEEFAEFLKKLYGPSTSKSKTQVRARANNSDMLYLPNFALGSVGERQLYDPEHRPERVAHQYRPSNPEKDASGKSLKYVFDSGSQTVLDVHPSTPKAYLDNPATVLFTEGVIKGDSTLTAYLRSHGFSADDLRVAGHASNPDQALHDMLLEIPAAERLLIVSVAGVYNWKQNPEWKYLLLKNSSVWTAFDGDLKTNRDVWDQTQRLMDFVRSSKHVAGDRVFLVDLASVPVGPNEDKVGLDDFFAAHGTFDDLPGMLTGELPAPPQRAIEAFVGTYQMNASATALQKCLPATEFGPARWANVVGIGARIVRTSIFRQPTVQEENTWTLNTAEVEADRREVVIDFGYLEGTESGDLEVDERTAAHHHAQMTAPMSILQMLPTDWGRTEAQVPPEILTLAEWPPRKDGETFLREMKAARRDEIEHFERWSRMGWVPTNTPNSPAFVIGDQVVEPDGVQSGALPGVGEEELPNVSGLGIRLRDPRHSDEQHREHVRRALETVLDIFLVNTPWQDKRIGALMLAASLRPALPKRPHIPIYLVGAAKSGKALPIDAEVPVPASTDPRGVKTVGDLVAGEDAIIGSDGQATGVRWKSAVHEARIFDVHFADGRVVTASDRHVWPVRLPRPGSTVSADAETEYRRWAFLAAQNPSHAAGRIDDIADAHGIDAAELAEAVGVAGIASVTALTADDSCRSGRGWTMADIAPILDEHALTPMAVNAETITVDDLSRWMPETLDHLPAPTVWAKGCRVDVLYPIGEALMAYGETFVGGRPLTLSLTTQELFDSGLHHLPIAAIEPPAQAWEANSAQFSRGAALARAVREGGNGDIDETLLSADIGDRVGYLRGFVATSLRLLGRTDLRLPSDDDSAITVPDERVRHWLVSLMRSVGWSPASAADGTILFRPTSEEAVVTHVVEAGVADCQCINVDRFDGQFAAADFMLTHNSWTAATAMQFWDSGKNWTEDTLPGSASDTKAATENAVSLAPIWVVDDLAPSSDPRKAEKEQEALESLLRAIHNNTGKRRSSGSGAQQEVKRPQAMLIATAENDIGIHSVLSRIITVRLGRNSLVTEAMERMRNLRGTGIAPSVTGALIEYVANKRYLAEEDRDLPLKNVIEDRFDQLSDDLRYVVQSKHGFADSDFDRQSKVLADLLLIVQPLRRMATDYGVDEKYIKLLSVQGEDTLGEAVTDLVVDSFANSQTGGPGFSLLRALKQVLRTKSAHIANAYDPQQPPVLVTDADKDAGAKAANAALGWTFTEQGAKPMGKEIGVLYQGKDGYGEPTILFYPRPAFTTAKRESPDLIPYGSSERTSWQAVWEDKLAVDGMDDPSLPKRVKLQSGSRKTSVQISVNSQRISCVPVPLDVLNEID